ncbi:MAG: glycosyltransferase family 4 protein [Actinomycetota bacterium]|nr:glycosyltransferase family 4 protein [Actinomycetota bacterium]
MGTSRDNWRLRRGSGVAAPAARGGGPLRLLFVTDSLEVGGAERHVVDLMLALRREGHDVTVACSVAGPLSEPLEGAGIPVRPLLDRLAKRRLSLSYARKLRRLLRGGRFDLVHAHIYASVAAAAIATLGTGVPLVVTEHTEAPWRSRRARLFSRWIYRRAERMIAVSGEIRRLLIEGFAVPPERVTFVPNAVVPVPDAPLGEASPGSPPEREDGWREGPLIGRVARLQPEKGMDTFLRAAARVAPLFPEANFLVVGDGPLREELVALSEHLGLGRRVHFLGYRSDARALIGLLDVLVVSSLSDGAPLVILEAMGAGVPVVASVVGGIPDQVRHEREGLLVPPGDPVALGDAILCLLQEPAHARRLGEAGRQRAASEFGYATLLRRVEAVYRAALLGRDCTGKTNFEEAPLRMTRTGGPPVG